MVLLGYCVSIWLFFQAFIPYYAALVLIVKLYKLLKRHIQDIFLEFLLIILFCSVMMTHELGIWLADVIWMLYFAMCHYYFLYLNLHFLTFLLLN